MEEGEIIDDEVDDYTPLQRPEILDTAPRVVSPELSEPEQSAEDSESDDSDEPRAGPKKQKLKPSLLNRQQQARPKKYNVWCSGIQEEVLTQELTNCEVAQRYERSRDIESYDYTRFRQQNPDDYNCLPSNNKRHFDDRQFQGVRARLGRRRGSADNMRGSSRNILSLIVTAASSDEEVAKDIANKLSEEKEDLILRVVEVLGKEKALELFEMTKKIEDGGGMLTMNQTRRRTPGGVFLFHVRGGCDQEQNQKIFLDDRRQFASMRRIERAKIRQQQAQKLHRELQAGNLLGEPSSVRAEALSGGEDEEPGAGVSNPPPSPATDGRADSSPEPCPSRSPPGRTLTTYDDVIDLNASYEMDNMDVF